MTVDFLSVNPKKWTTNKENNIIVIRIIQGYIKKHNEIYGEYRRNRFAITVGDELPNGVLQLATVYVAKKRKVKVGDKLSWSSWKQRYCCQNCKR